VLLFRQRTLVPEEMDRPDLPAEPHRHALDGLARLNAWSGSAGILWPSIRRLSAEITDRPIRLLDVACGAGDVLVGLARRASQSGIVVELRGVDVSSTAVEHARRRIAATGLHATLEQHNVFSATLPTGFDVVTCSLFLHHLTEDQAIELLRRMAAATQRLVLVNDLRRSTRGWMLAVAACRLLSRSPIVHVDGPRSVAAAFTPAEALAIAQTAGLGGATIGRRWPFRFLLSWDRSNVGGPA
jgi:2-polyprenyl-3-methyl-5-hydroxy-6-metoxy-1,4-benzoquinol methylase